MYSHANEEPISRENKREEALIGVPGGRKALTGTGLIKTDSAGSFEKMFPIWPGRWKQEC